MTDTTRPMRPLNPSSTLRLSRATFEPKATTGLPARLLILVLALGIVVLLAARNGYLDVPYIAPSRFTEAERNNAVLARELDRARTDLAVERATRIEVQKHADELGGEVARLTRQLEFLQSRTTTTPKE